MNNKSFKENLIPKNKHSLSPDKSIIIDNDEDFESDDDEINDTIRCETPKNIEEVDEIARTYNGKMNRKFYR